MGDVVGRLFREFAVTLAIAILVSAVVSLTLTPMMCARILRHVPEERQSRLARASDAIFKAWIDRYATTLRWVLRHQMTTLVVFAAALAMTGVLYVVVPKGFFPVQDTGVIMFISLKPLAERGVSADAVIARLRRRFANEPRTNVFFQAVQDIRVGGRASNAQYQFTLQADSLEDLTHWTPLLTARLRRDPLLADVSSDQENRGLQTTIAIDRDQAARLGVTARAIDETLYDAFGQRQVSTMYTALNQYHVVMEAAPEFVEHPEALQDIYTRSSTGALVPFNTFASYQPDTAPLSVNHQSQFPATTLTFNLRQGASLSNGVAVVDAAMFSHTSTKSAPWYIIPANNKWFSRLAVAAIVIQTLEDLDLQYPKVSKEKHAELQKTRDLLMEEDD